MGATADTTGEPLQPGDPRVLGPYEVVGRLGAGGQGAVFLGRGPAGDLVAIKLLRADLAEDTGARGRFVREAMAARQVARFCAAQVLDADVAGDRPYIVSEYVQGPSLLRLVKEQGPVSGAALERLAIGTATALVAIHQAGIVHRDLKPANVLAAPDGPRVIDFGIAKALSGTSTVSSQIIGTPAYMAPEQLEGGSLTSAVDVFAWAATMVFVGTGRPPFGADAIPRVVNRILTGDPDLGDMAGPVRALVTDCLAKDPARRPSARQILLRLLAEEEVIPEATRAASGEVGADVLAQAATLAAGPTPLLIPPAAAPPAAAPPAAIPPVSIPPVSIPPGQAETTPMLQAAGGLRRRVLLACCGGLAVAMAAVPLAIAVADSGNHGRKGPASATAGAEPQAETSTFDQSSVPTGTGDGSAPQTSPDPATTRPHVPAPTGTGRPTATPTWTPTHRPTWTPPPSPDTPTGTADDDHDSDDPDGSGGSGGSGGSEGGSDGSSDSTGTTGGGALGGAPGGSGASCDSGGCGAVSGTG